MRSRGSCWAWPTLCPQMRALTIDSTELLGWYEQRAARPAVAPARCHAWQILVSEFMLQQTPVSRVEPVWLDWVRRWPTPSATAAAGAADVLRAWGKLGYPRRAKRLHECATVIAGEHGDVVPRRRRDTARPAGRRRVHRARGRLLRVRAAGAGRRHERAPGGRAGGPRSGRRAGSTSPATSPTSPRCCPKTRRAALFGGADGAGRDGVHRPVAPLRRLPAERVRVAGRRSPSRRDAGPPCADLRGHRPAGARHGCWMCCAPTIFR